MSGISPLCQVWNSNQFEQGQSEYECGEYATAQLYYAWGYKGCPHGVTGSPEQVDQYADTLYTQHVGANVTSDTTGTSDDTQLLILLQSGLHYQVIEAISMFSQHAHDIAEIQACLEKGYVVQVTVPENSVFDVELGRNPYNWTPTGTHIINCTGMDSNGNVLCSDSASIEPGVGVRPYPRVYDTHSIIIHRAVLVVLEGQTRPPVGYDPLTNQPPLEGNTTHMYTQATEDDITDFSLFHVSLNENNPFHQAWLQAKWEYGVQLGIPLNGTYNETLRDGSVINAELFTGSKMYELTPGTIVCGDARGVVGTFDIASSSWKWASDVLPSGGTPTVPVVDSITPVPPVATPIVVPVEQPPVANQDTVVPPVVEQPPVPVASSLSSTTTITLHPGKGDTLQSLIVDHSLPLRVADLLSQNEEEIQASQYLLRGYFLGGETITATYATYSGGN